MHIFDLDPSNSHRIPMSRSLAYLLGMVYPLYNECKILDEEDDKDYVMGSVNHNSGQIESDEMFVHYGSVYTIMKEFDNKSPLIKSNSVVNKKQKDGKYNRRGVKDGFSILIEKTDIGSNTYDSNKCKQILAERIKEISNSGKVDISKEFVKGCFDGRSSYDNGSYMSVEHSLDASGYKLVEEVIEITGLKNYGENRIDDPRADTLRVNKKDFMDRIGMYCTCRMRLFN